MDDALADAVVDVIRESFGETPHAEVDPGVRDELELCWSARYAPGLRHP